MFGSVLLWLKRAIFAGQAKRETKAADFEKPDSAYAPCADVEHVRSV